MCIYVEEGKGRAGLIKLLMTMVYKSTRRRANTAVYFWQRKHGRICHVLHEIIEGRMKGKPTTGRRRIHMLHDLANDDGYYVPLKRAADGREE